jgi:predicted DNA-binding WGR domain protein
LEDKIRGRSITMMVFDELESIERKKMVGEIHVTTQMLAHAGGTKFYEVIQFANVDAKKFVLVKRWGKVAVANGGGECKVETFPTHRKLEEAANKIITSKRGRDYELATSSHGFHAMGVSYRSAEDFNSILTKHYTTGAPISEVLIGMGIADWEPTTSQGKEDDEIISETPEPEPERDADYGSW